MSEVVDAASPPSVPPPPVPAESPREIIEAKVREVTKQSGGTFVGDLYVTSNDDATMLRFGVRVPAMQDFRQGILTAVHPNDRTPPTAWLTPIRVGRPFA